MKLSIATNLSWRIPKTYHRAYLSRIFFITGIWKLNQPQKSLVAGLSKTMKAKKTVNFLFKTQIQLLG
jgi:hypothetical protein